MPHRHEDLPRIGITAGLIHPDPNRNLWRPKTLFAVEAEMLDYVHRAGAAPVLIPDLEEEPLRDFLHDLDGIILQGGADIAPKHYWEEPILDGRWPGDEIRDEYELKVMREVMSLELPVFGICRGFQLMCVYFGSNLYQDIATQRPGALMHRDPDPYDRLNHPVVLVEGSLIHDWYADSEIRQVNSVHHQGVRDLGEDLEPWAEATDGILEAVGWKGAEPGKVFAVQWHPEWGHNVPVPVMDGDHLINKWMEIVRREMITRR